MNAIVTIDVATLTPATVFAPGGVEAIVSKIEAEVSAEVFTLETAEGRERIKSVAYRIARSKTALDEMGKELVAGIKAQAATIDAERRTIRDRLDALKESVRGPLTAWEDAEAARAANHEGVLVWIVQASQFESSPTAAAISERMAALENEAQRDWQEFAERAIDAYQATREKLTIMLAAAEQAEADAAELAELRRMKAERDAADAARLIEEARLAREADAARIAAQQAAERKAYEERRERERAEKAAQQATEAAARAVEQERERAAKVKAAEEAAAAKLAANKKHRAKVHAEIVQAISQAFDGAEYSPDRMAEAIAAGIIPHVSITY